MTKKIGVIVTVEDKPADDKDFAKYLILLMEWEKRVEQRKQVAV